MDSPSRVNPDPRRDLPSVDVLARDLAGARPGLPQWAQIAAARHTLETVRAEIAQALAAGAPVAAAALPEAVLARALRLAEGLVSPRPRRVLNATGVVLHTNLGRAPLAPAAAEAAARAAAGYSDLELDLETGRRGNRHGALGEKLALLCGAEAGHACNNNAAALMLALDTLARGREVVVSRGELVEIGGSFRVPDIVERSGVRLVEVGTTNRTHARDYEAAIGAQTGLLLKVHRSNFAQTGFVAEVGLRELVGIGRRHGIAVVEDLGSGTVVDVSGWGLPQEAHVPSRVAQQPDVVCFSGDKLLGGPQAGLAVGRREAVDAMRRNPLARALRLDKLGIAALDWTLTALLDGRVDEIPVLRSLREPPGAIARRAEQLAKALEAAAGGRAAFEVVALLAPVGGGSLPGFEL